MKKITDLKKLLCLSVSTATFLSIGCIAMADESEEITEDVPEGTEVIENDYCDEEIIEEYSAEEIIFEDDLYAAEEEFDALTVDEEELPEDLIEDLETIDMEEVSASYTGWKQEYNRWYYYIDGEIYKGGWLQLKGKRYYLSKSSGFMYTGMWDIDDKVYLFDGSGVMQTGWVKYDMDWYYFGSDGAAASGWKTIDNKKYYFDEYECEMYTGSRIINDSWYYFGTDGVLNKGWQQPWGSDGEWSYYGTDGKAVSGWNKIGDHWYYFYQRATFEPPVMVSDQYAKLDGFYYGFDDNGRMIKGWKNFGSESRPTWLYFDSKGKAVRGFNKIGDNWYYFDEDEDSAPVMYRNRMVSIDGSVYRFDGNGAMHTGWYKEGSDKFPTWYYFKSSGKAATGWTEINGKMYYFSQNTNSPSMYMNGIYTIDGESYYFDSNGVMQKNYWYLQSNYNDDYYFGSDGKRVKGWQKIDNKWYYFKDAAGYAPYLLKGYCRIGDKYYYFDPETGAMTTGWVDLGSKKSPSWHYFGSNGEINGWKKISGKWYYLSDYGMYKNGFRSIEGKTYYFAENGVLQTGWMKIRDSWYYAEASGEIVPKGWKIIDDKCYYFDYYGEMVTGLYYIDGDIYDFGSNGVCKKPPAYLM